MYLKGQIENKERKIQDLNELLTQVNNFNF